MTITAVLVWSHYPSTAFGIPVFSQSHSFQLIYIHFDQNFVVLILLQFLEFSYFGLLKGPVVVVVLILVANCDILVKGLFLGHRDEATTKNWIHSKTFSFSCLPKVCRQSIDDYAENGESGEV